MAADLRADDPKITEQDSIKEAWWVCSLGHSYESSVNSRVSSGSGCPICSGKQVLTGFNDLATVFPEIAKEWHPEKNGDLNPSLVTKCSGKKAWWVCSLGHSYESSVISRVRGYGCPYCAGKKVLQGFNDLATVFPEIAKEWHPEKNGDLYPSLVTKCSTKRVWWLCPFGHSYRSLISSRTNNGSGCPFCAGNKIHRDDSIAIKTPELMAEWDFVNNYSLCDPYEISEKSNASVWWQCPNNSTHRYLMSPYNRVIYLNRSRDACPYCKGLRRKKTHFI